MSNELRYLEICIEKSKVMQLTPFMIERLEDVAKRFRELEESIKPKTCEGCIRLYFDEIEKVYKCWNDVSDDVGYLHGEAVIRNIKDFCCNQFQPKDIE